jgi:hypothetical protein
MKNQDPYISRTISKFPSQDMSQTNNPRLIWVPVQVPVQSIQGQLPTNYADALQYLPTTSTQQQPSVASNYMPILQISAQQPQLQPQQQRLQSMAMSRTPVQTMQRLHTAALPGYSAYTSGTNDSYAATALRQQSERAGSQYSQTLAQQRQRSNAMAAAQSNGYYAGSSRARATAVPTSTGTNGDLACEPAFLGDATCGYAQFGDDVPIPDASNVQSA